MDFLQSAKVSASFFLERNLAHSCLFTLLTFNLFFPDAFPFNFIVLLYFLFFFLILIIVTKLLLSEQLRYKFIRTPLSFFWCQDFFTAAFWLID